ncbi:MAG: hypothetical protein GXO92_07625 [FCB group bacterium]|nr:hypothetical protein [FCB group bacterium]
MQGQAYANRCRPWWLVVIIAVVLNAQPGILKVGFDLDDTILYSRYVFENAPLDEQGRLDYGWINRHDRQYSILIDPTVKLVKYFLSHGHEVYFITARSGQDGDQLARFLSDVLGFQVVVDKNLFFTPKEEIGGKRFTTKQRVMKALNLDIFYGDADTDIIAALKADVHPVRIVRHPSSIKQYGSNYFGNTLIGTTDEAPFTASDLEQFYNARVGFLGETIYPIVWEGPPKPKEGP